MDRIIGCYNNITQTHCYIFDKVYPTATFLFIFLGINLVVAVLLALLFFWLSKEKKVEVKTDVSTNGNQHN
jgi:hypothetical protein